MSSSFVWVQLYYKGMEGHPIQFYQSDLAAGREWNIASLAEAAKAKLSPKIDYAPLNEIFVYPPETKPPFSQAKSERPGKRLADIIEELKDTTPPTSDEHPLIVVAPAPASYPPVPPRTLCCRLWVGDDVTVYELPAPTFEILFNNVLSKFALADDQEISLYYITNKKDIGTRRFVSNDADLGNFFALAGKPILFVWLRGDPSMSPNSIPSQLELQHLSLSDGESISSSSGRGYPQELFREAVRVRDKQKCVLSGTPLRPKTGNVEAAHIFGVERSLAQERQAAGVMNAYDTQNGLLLESSLHTDFDSFLWCMDEFLNVHVSELGKAKGLGYLQGTKVNLCVDQQNYPTKKILRARYQLFLKQLRAQAVRADPRKRRRQFTTATTI